MNESCAEAQKKLQISDSSTKFLLEHAHGLSNERQSVATRQLLSKVFLHGFTLTKAEIESLTNPEIQINHQLFSSIDHCEEIRLNCAYLLSSNSVAGLDIMKSINLYLDKAYDKIFKFASISARNGLAQISDGVSQLEVSGLMKKTFSRLRKRPELFEETLTILSKARSNILMNLFLDALTRGGPNGVPRPIELNAHDPIRYMGDMLAWLHQAMASEDEFLESLLDLKFDGRRVGETRTFSSAAVAQTDQEILQNDLVIDDRDRLVRLLDQHLEGCIRPMKIRIHQTIQSQEGSLMTYQLAGLLEFYLLTMQNTIGPQAKLTSTLDDLAKAAYERFYALLRQLSINYIRDAEPPPIDLSIPPVLSETMRNLTELIRVYEDSTSIDGNQPSKSHTGEDHDSKSFDKVLDLVIDPTIDLIEKMAHFRASDRDRSIFWVNCLEYVQHTLKPLKLPEYKIEQIQNRLDQHLSTLIKEHFDHLLISSGLQSVYDAIKNKDLNIPLSRNEATSSKSIYSSVQAFDRFLIDLDPTCSNRLILISSKSISTEIHRHSLDLLSKVYEQIWDEVMDEKNLYEFCSTILIRSKDEVNTLIR